MTLSISVIIPTFNRAQLLCRALESVFAQTVLPDEVCVVDDGSTDDTAQLVGRLFPQVNYLYQSNQGVSAARNRGVDATEGEWVAFLDNDDEWLPNKLEVQLQALRLNPGFRLVHAQETWIRNGVRVNQKRKHRKSGGE